MKYTVGTNLVYRSLEEGEIHGKVIENFKLPGDVCVCWETGLVSSYDPEWLDEYAEIVS